MEFSDPDLGSALGRKKQISFDEEASDAEKKLDDFLAGDDDLNHEHKIEVKKTTKTT